MAAPAVQNLSDVISSLTAANQPTLDNLNQQDANITNSANAGVQAIGAQKDAAFGQITNNAATRGALFSGFTPDAQAKYTAATYLPALAKLQQSITDSRTALAGQKATLLSNINNQANSTVNSEKTALQQWQDQQDAAAAKAAADAQTLAEQQAFTDQQRQATEQFTGGQNDLNRQNTITAAAIKANAAAAKVAANPPATGYKVVKNANTGGVEFTNKNGQPITAYTYLQAGNPSANVSTGDIATLLGANASDSGTQQVINDINSGATTDYLLQKYPYIFGQ